MATHSSVLAWRIPGKKEPGGLPSMGLNSTEVNLAAEASFFLVIISKILLLIQKKKKKKEKKLTICSYLPTTKLHIFFSRVPSVCILCFE